MTKIKRFVSYCGEKILLLSQRSLNASNFHLQTRSETSTPFVNCVVNNALIHAARIEQQATLQFVNVIHPLTINPLLKLYDIVYLAVNQIEIGAVGRIIEVKQRRARLVLGWVTGKPSKYVTSQLGRLSLSSLRGW